jgi:formylglycine-generating enzyme required for sulfatase activity
MGSHRLSHGIRIGCVVAALALGACDRMGQALDDMRPNVPTEVPPTRIDPADDSDIVPLPAPIPPWERNPESEILFSLEAWDGASSSDRDEAARSLIERLIGFRYVGLETFSAGGQKHEVALFEHERTYLVFVLVPAGTYRLGSPGSEAGRSFDEVRRNVTLTRPFLISRTEVTQSAWATVRSKNPSKFRDPLLPVETVTIIDVERFLSRAKLELPTEAQWEVACRAGTKGAYSFGKKADDLGDHAWYEANAGGKTHPVATKKGNAFGLHDMHGNVLEWCRDGYEVLDEGDATDPVGPSSAGDRVVRGGSWQNAATVQRSAFRMRTHPADKQAGIGFRPVKTVPPPR